MVCVTLKKKWAAFSKRKMCLCGTHPLHTNYISPSCEAAQFQGQISITVCLCLYICQETASLCLSVNVYSNDPICSPTIQTTGLYGLNGIPSCKGIPCDLSMRHRFTVAGNNKRLFYSPLCYFNSQNCYIKCA